MRHFRLVGVISGRQLLELSRMGWVIAVMFAPGIVLYAVFTAVFSGSSESSGPNLTLAIVDQDHSTASEGLIESLEEMSIHVKKEQGEGKALSMEDAQGLVHRRKVSAGLIIPSGYGEHPWSMSPGHEGVDLLVDETQPFQAQMVTGMLQMAAGRAMFAPMAALGGGDDQVADGNSAGGMLLAVHTQSVATNRKSVPMSLIYLAGLIPMFLLFNSQGAASGLLAELQAGSIRRMLVAPISAGHILGGQMVTAMILAIIQ